MSIEQALAENTAAIRELIEAIKTGVPTTAAQVEAVVTEAKVEAPAAEEKVKQEEHAPEPKAEAPAAKEEKPARVELPREEVSYDQVKDAIIGLSKTKGRAAAVAVLDQFGVDVATKLTADQYPAVVQAAKAALEG